MMRQIILDTETTGLDPATGHRVIEIGAVEIINRRITGQHYHQYLNPQRVVEEQAIAVHGLNNQFLADKPLFADIVTEFLAYIEGAELIIHNAAFDIKFLQHELRLANLDPAWLSSRVTVTDSLLMAREKHPGQKNSLDALCKRYKVANSHRSLHGALLDANLLAQVYLAMTGGQKTLSLGELAIELTDKSLSHDPLQYADRKAHHYGVSESEWQEHQRLLTMLAAKKKSDIFWQE